MSARTLPALLLLAACGGHGASGASASASASAQPPASAAAPVPAAPAATPRPSTAAPADPNPLRLPPAKLALDPGHRVFTFPEPMLAAARPGATLVLQPAIVKDFDGDDLVIDGRGGPEYKVHAGYAIAVPDDPRLKPGDPVIAEHNGALKHGVVTKFVRDRVGVRFTDLEGRAPELMLLGGSGKPIAGEASKALRLIKQLEGLRPGNYAALRRGEEWLHVLLVSASGEGDARRWFALGYGGAAMIVMESELLPIPVRFATKPGRTVWAESGGKMRRATVEKEGDRGLFIVKFERAGRAQAVGWGRLMVPQQDG